MGSSPLVSIVMPLYNKRPYVKRAIDSIQRQTFSDWELIIVDDGSTDGSVSEIPRNDTRIRLFHQENKGPGAARNVGTGMALGEFVTFIDADDYYYPHKLEEEMTLLWKEQKAEWMISAFEYQSDNQITLRSICDINGNELKGAPLIFNNALKQLTVKGWHVDGLCIRKNLLERVGGFLPDMRYKEITELMIRCALIEPRTVIFPTPLYCVVGVPNSASKESFDRTEGHRQMGESLHNLSEDYPEFSNYLKHRSQKSMFAHVLSLILSGKSDKARAYLTKAFPYTSNKEWWKFWILSWVPEWLLQRFRDSHVRKKQI